MLSSAPDVTGGPLYEASLSQHIQYYSLNHMDQLFQGRMPSPIVSWPWFAWSRI